MFFPGKANREIEVPYIRAVLILKGILRLERTGKCRRKNGADPMRGNLDLERNESDGVKKNVDY